MAKHIVKALSRAAELEAELSLTLVWIGCGRFDQLRQRIRDYFFGADIDLLEARTRKLGQRLRRFLAWHTPERCLIAQAALSAIIRHPQEFESNRVVGAILLELFQHTSAACPHGCSNYLSKMDGVINQIVPLFTRLA